MFEGIEGHLEKLAKSGSATRCPPPTAVVESRLVHLQSSRNTRGANKVHSVGVRELSKVRWRERLRCCNLAQATMNAPPKKLYAMDALRGIAALWVLFFHLNEGIEYRNDLYGYACRLGYLGVSAFFS